jgi:hypothetical protein
MAENAQASRIIPLLAIDQNGVMKTTGMLHQMSGVYSLTIVASNSDKNGSASVSLEVLSTQSCQPKFIERQPTVLYLNSTVSYNLGFFSKINCSNKERKYIIFGSSKFLGTKINTKFSLLENWVILLPRRKKTANCTTNLTTHS